MMTPRLSFLLLLSIAILSQATGLTTSTTFAAPADKAATTSLKEAGEQPDFQTQGEYVTEGRGVQVIALGDGEFECVIYPGGLPGAGWDRSEPTRLEANSDDVLDLVDGYERVDRQSPTLKAAAPENATILFDGQAETLQNHWKDSAKMTEAGLLREGASGTTSFEDFTLHLEFFLPYTPEARGQGRANSGVYLQGRYEVQVLDSFGLKGRNNECGGLYSLKDPDVNMCLPPLSWQTYDIDFMAARYGEDGQKTANARVTVRHNGVVIHNDVELPEPSPGAPNKESAEPGPLFLQNHGNPVRYRNIWAIPRDFSRLAARPIIPGFERFHTGPSADLAAGGRLLLGELNCASCHKLESDLQKFVSTKEAPRLSTVGQRIQPEYLLDFLSAPHEVKPGTTMPDLFAGQSDEQRRKSVEPIVHFLASTGTPLHQPPSVKNAAKGARLFREIGCVACHAPHSKDVKTPAGTTVPLVGLERKYSVRSLAEFLKDPHAVRPSGRMPNFKLAEDEPIELAEYLLRDRDPNLSRPHWNYKLFAGRYSQLADIPVNSPTGNGVSVGLDLSVAGTKDRFAIHFSGFLNIEQAGDYRFFLGSDDGSRLTINDRELITFDGIHAHQLKSASMRLEPGLHPILVEYFEASGFESLELLIEGPGIVRGDISGLVSLTDSPEPEKSETDEKGFVFDPDQVEEGKRLFASIGCASCHEMKLGDDRIASTLKAPELTAVSIQQDTSCLAPESAPQVPDYNLSDKQRTALRTALSTEVDRSESGDAARLHASMVRFNCYACHSRNEIGGPEQSRNPLFVSTIPEMGDEGRVPPPLDGVADKLSESWLKHVLSNGAKDRPYMKTRMPQFGGEVAELTPAFVRLDEQTSATIPELEESLHRAKATGRELVGGNSLSCIKCHTFGDIEATGIQAIDLLTMTRRLREDWFYRYLQDPVRYRPGTRMPNVFPEGVSADRKIYDGDPGQQIAAMWHYLRDGNTAAVPYGLLPDPIELVAEQEPVIYRNFIEHVSPRGIAVGYPEKANVAFDASDMSLRLIWHGPFIDAGKHWRGRGQGKQRPLGDHVIRLESTTPLALLDSRDSVWPTGDSNDVNFLGYSLDEKRRPRFRYRMGETLVEDAIEPIVHEKREPDLRRTLTVQRGEDPSGDLYFRAGRGQKIEAIDGGAYRVWYSSDSNYRVKLSAGADAHVFVRGSEGQQELLLVLPTGSSQQQITQTIEW
ncbi:family 16 glycoside hydrolase [Rubinisphaera margarita]|uniref:family 16 glycoside hydrolase n=1 Tax=Rubinisphaera margarita TaxID=2909586 RepID=UPI001EE8D06B|nr:family 16 glycoside hydrolase [Rubinisphaera margarita]MCG6156452.1 DUF1080 domain-containing protein [Rubinisphaera margarita]